MVVSDSPALGELPCLPGGAAPDDVLWYAQLSLKERKYLMLGAYQGTGGVPPDRMAGTGPARNPAVFQLPTAAVD